MEMLELAKERDAVDDDTDASVIRKMRQARRKKTETIFMGKVKGKAAACIACVCACTYAGSLAS
jgi:hypothetical protein